MTSKAAALLREALSLPKEERDELVEALLESLEPPPGVLSEDDPTFLAEIARRADEARPGVPGVAWVDVRGRIEADLRSRQR